MHRMLSAIAATVIFTALAPAGGAAAATWDIDTSHSKVGFVVKHLAFAKVRGDFQTWAGTVVIDEKDLAKSRVDVTIEATSINTGNEKRDTHLRSPDFFDVAKFKQLTFKSTKVEKGAQPSTLKVTGDLTLHGVTKPVVLEVSGPSAEFKDPTGNAHVAFSATAKINRKDFGLMWSMATEAAPIVSDDVVLEIDVELFKKR